MGFNRDGGYGAYVLVSESIFLPVESTLPLTEATLLLDVMGTTAHAIARAQCIHPDLQSVVVTGAGPIGLGVLAMAKIILGDALLVLIADINPWRWLKGWADGRSTSRKRPWPAARRWRLRLAVCHRRWLSVWIAAPQADQPAHAAK